jgi:hypothetical protein
LFVFDLTPHSAALDAGYGYSTDRSPVFAARNPGAPVPLAEPSIPLRSMRYARSGY